jgi:hypothetical protein
MSSLDVINLGLNINFKKLVVVTIFGVSLMTMGCLELAVELLDDDVTERTCADDIRDWCEDERTIVGTFAQLCGFDDFVFKETEIDVIGGERGEGSAVYEFLCDGEGPSFEIDNWNEPEDLDDWQAAATNSESAEAIEIVRDVYFPQIRPAVKTIIYPLSTEILDYEQTVWKHITVFGVESNACAVDEDQVCRTAAVRTLHSALSSSESMAKSEMRLAHKSLIESAHQLMEVNKESESRTVDEDFLADTMQAMSAWQTAFDRWLKTLGY